MTNVFRIAKAVVLLVIAAFIIMVIVGVYTALDAAPGYTLASSAHALSEADEDTVGDGAAVTSGSDLSGDDTDGATALAAPSVSPLSAEEVEATSAPSSVPVSSGTASNSTGTSSSNQSGNTSASINSGSGNSNATGNSGSSAPAVPTQVFHPAWDEWVEGGYWESTTIPATYGERSVYGSVCSECGATISGHAMQHLKDTHHSGYFEGVVGIESYEITPAKTQQVWVDTSHWVHHGEYWE